MIRKFKISGQRTLYLDKDIVDQGFKEEVDGYANAYTLTIARKDATLEQIRDSLMVVLQDVEMRMKHEKDTVK